MDTIRIRGLKTQGVVGVHAWERKLPRLLLIDLDLATDAARAARSDAIGDALDYHAVAQAVASFVAQSQAQLLETLAERLAAMLEERFGTPWVSLTLHKPGAVPEAADVAVSIERGHRP